MLDRKFYFCYIFQKHSHDINEVFWCIDCQKKWNSLVIKSGYNGFVSKILIPLHACSKINLYDMKHLARILLMPNNICWMIGSQKFEEFRRGDFCFVIKNHRRSAVIRHGGHLHQVKWYQISVKGLDFPKKVYLHWSSVHPTRIESKPTEKTLNTPPFLRVVCKVVHRLEAKRASCRHSNTSGCSEDTKGPISTEILTIPKRYVPWYASVYYLFFEWQCISDFKHQLKNISC